MRSLPLILSLALAACSSPPAPRVRIEAPTDGAEIAANSVSVQLAASGIEIAPADGEPTPGRAHYHLFLDTDLTPAGEPIPKETPGITHLGTGASSFTVRDLGPGRHRLIAVLALGDHVPLDPLAVDTVFFSVAAMGD